MLFRYDGELMHYKTKSHGKCVVKIKYEREKIRMRTCYIDAKNSTYLGKFANHSRNSSAFLSKMIVDDEMIRHLWIEVIESIKQNDEYVLATENNTIIF